MNVRNIELAYRIHGFNQLDFSIEFEQLNTVIRSDNGWVKLLLLKKICSHPIDRHR